MRTAFLLHRRVPDLTPGELKALLIIISAAAIIFGSRRLFMRFWRKKHCYTVNGKIVRCSPSETRNGLVRYELVIAYTDRSGVTETVHLYSWDQTIVSADEAELSVVDWSDRSKGVAESFPDLPEETYERIGQTHSAETLSNMRAAHRTIEQLEHARHLNLFDLFFRPWYYVPQAEFADKALHELPKGGALRKVLLYTVLFLAGVAVIFCLLFIYGLADK
ncbi:MAG: hypothetical protein IJ071_10980 [Ruminococcus sp.]|nr:hypothetical protein [Ruminococcus sp.]